MNLRYWIALCENATSDLPPKAQAFLGKTKQVTIKDGITASIQIEFNPNHQGIIISAKIDGEYAGSLDLSLNDVPSPVDDYDFYAEDRGSWSATNVWVDKSHSRKGLATAMYDFAASLGFKILRSGAYGGKLTPDGSALWQSNLLPLRFGKPLPKQSRFWKVRKKPLRPNNTSPT